MKKIFSNLILVFLLTDSAFAAPLLCEGKQVLGRVETVILVDTKLKLDAKLDTGAAMSSLSAKDITTFQRNNVTYAKFTFVNPMTHEKYSFTKPVVRFVNILKRKEEQKNSANKFSKRPVVAIPIQIGNQQKTIPVNLIDRSDFNYSMLIGADTLKAFNVLVDVSRKHLASPE